MSTQRGHHAAEGSLGGQTGSRVPTGAHGHGRPLRSSPFPLFCLLAYQQSLGLPPYKLPAFPEVWGPQLEALEEWGCMQAFRGAGWRILVDLCGGGAWMFSTTFQRKVDGHESDQGPPDARRGAWGLL